MFNITNTNAIPAYRISLKLDSTMYDTFNISEYWIPVIIEQDFSINGDGNTFY
jgi:hypothetical protein